MRKLGYGSIRRFSSILLTATAAAAALGARPASAVSLGSNYFAVTPCRAIDTRLPAGPMGGPSFAANELRIFTITGTCGVPANAIAVSGFLIAVKPAATGVLRIFPANVAEPVTNNITFDAGVTRAGNGIAVLATDNSGTLAIRNASAGTLDVVVDITGYLASTCPPITVDPPALSSVADGAPVNVTLTASGGFGPYTFAVTSGALPPGVTLSPAGVLSGTATASGSFPFTATATDFNNCTGSTAYTLVLTCPAITVTPTTLSPGAVGVPYTQVNFNQTGAVGAVTWSFTGSLPTGMTLSAAGVLSGTPTQAGTFPITVKATDAGGCTGSVSVTLSTCPAVTVTNPATSSATAGTPFSQTFTQGGGAPPIAFTVASGTLPTGLTLAANGTLSGTPTQTGTFPLTVKATDVNGCFGTGGVYPLVVGCGIVTVTNPGVTTGTANSPFSQTFTQTGGIGAVTFSLASGTLPAGVTLAANGTLSGTPTQTGSFPITVKATDSNTCNGTGATYTLVVNCQTITVTKPVVSGGTVGSPFSQTFTQTNAIGTATFTTASTLPAGLTLATNGVLSGTPTQTGSFPIVVTVTDSNGCTGTSSTYSLVIGCQTILVTNPAAATGTVSTPFSQAFTQVGAAGTATFTTASTLPNGLTLATNGTLSGTPTQAGTFPIVVTVTDSNGCTGIGATYTLVVSCQTFSVQPTTIPPGTAGTLYPAVAFKHAGGIDPVVFTFTGTLPTGMSLVSGLLQGTPTQTGSFPFTVIATDVNGCTASRDYVLVVSCVGVDIVLAPASLPTVVVGSAFPATTFLASGGTAGYTFQQIGALPNGMQFVTDTLSGTPTQTGAFPITVVATDAAGCVGSQEYVVTVTCVGVTITVDPPTVPSVQAGSPFGPVTFTGSGGTGPYTFVKTGVLPPGMFMGPNTLSGSPTQQGTFPFTITATDANGCSGSTSYTLVVTCPTITVTNPATAAGTVNTFFTQSFGQTGGNGAVTFTLASGSLPTGMSLSSAGVLSGTPTQSGSFPITVKATDANGCTGTGTTYTLVIACQTITVTSPIVNSGLEGSAFVQTFSQSGAVGGTTFTLASGSLPAGWSLSSLGVLSNPGPAAGQFTITVKVTDANGCTGTSAGYTVTIAPLATSDTYVPAIVGNMSIDTATGTTFSVLTNDSAGSTPNLLGGGTTVQGGQVALNPLGQFTYNPPRGFEGVDTFQYTVTKNAVTSAPATVTLTVTGVVWFVNNNGGACVSNCDGRQTNPYTALDLFQAVNDGIGSNPKPGHSIFLYESPTLYTGPPVAPVALQNNQKLVGQDFAGTFAAATGLTVPDTTVGVPTMSPGFPFSSIVSVPGQNIVVLASDNTVRGLSLSPFNNAAIAIAAPANIGTGTIDQVSFSLGGSGSGIGLASHVGTLNVTNSTIVGNGTGTAVAISGAQNGSAIFTNTPINRTSGRLLDVQSRAPGGAVTFDAASVLTVTFAATDAIVLQNNAATTLSLLGGFQVTTTSGRGFLANNTGTVTIGGASNLINATGGAAFDVTSTTIAGSPTFTSVSSTSPSSQGLLFSSAGGGLTIGTTTVSGSGAQRILVTGSTATIAFGNTTLNGGSDAVSLQNNSSGTRSFGSLTIGNSATPSGIGFLHAVGGGSTTVSGPTAITNVSANGIDIQNSTTPITFTGVTITKASGTGVNLVSDALVTFGALSVSSPATGSGLVSSASSVSTSGGTIAVTGGPAVSATNTNFNSSSLASASSTTSATQGISLTTCSGSLTMSAGSITGAAGVPFLVSGGTVSATYGGGITQTAANAMVSVSGGHATGTITFQTGTLNASNGTGLQFDNADGTYNFNGTTTLNGGDAGIDILNGSSGSFSFGSNTSITSPSGTAFTLNGSNPTVTYSGNITKGNAGLMVDITSQSGGSVTFQTGTLSATAGSGIQLTTANGTTNFNGTTTLNGGSAAVLIQSTSTGTVNFGSNASITGPSTGTSFFVTTGSPTVSYAGTITQNNAQLALSVASNTGGTKTFSGAITSITNGKGISLTTNTGATIAFSGTLNLSTGANPAFTATGGGTVTATGTGSTLTTTTGTALNVASTTIGAAGLTFRSISSNGASSGIVLSATGALGGLTVTGNGSAGTGGTIQNSTGSGISIATLAGLNLSFMNVTNNGNAIDENGIRAFNVTGTSSLTSLTVTNSFHANVWLQNDVLGTSLAMTVTNSSFNSSQTHDGFHQVADGGAHSTVTISNSSFNNNFSDGLDAGVYSNSAPSTTLSDVSITTSSFNNNGANGILIAEAGSGDSKFNIFSNTSISGNPSDGINIFQNNGTTASGKIRGKINANTTNFTYNTANGGGVNIMVNAQGAGTATVELTNNVMSYNDGSNSAVIIQSGDGLVGSTIVKLAGNTINMNDTGANNFALRAINIESGLTAASTRTVCLNMGATTVNLDATSVANGVEKLRVRKRPNSFFNIQGLSPSPATTAPQVQSFLSSVSGLATTDIFVSGPATFQINYTAATCDTSASLLAINATE